MSAGTSATILIVLVFLSAFFSGAETALVSLSPAKVRNMVNSRRRGSRLVERLKEKPHRLLITILICNNLVNIGASVFATVTATHLFGEGYLAYVTGVLTLLILVFGEILPKTFAHKYSEQFSLLVAWPLDMCQVVFFPVIWILEKFIAWINTIMNIRAKSGKISNELIAEQELKAMIDISTEEGALEEEEAALIGRVIEFGEILVRDIMTPRNKICGIAWDKTVEEAVEVMVAEGLHSRLPVYSESLDHPVGFVTLRQAVNLMRNEGQKKRLLKDIELTPLLVVPLTQRAEILFKEFKWKHIHIALVVDQHGSVVGLVTLEDLLEELIGDIRDETDSEELQAIIKRNAESWSVDASVELGQFEHVTGIWLGTENPDDKRKSLSLLLIELIGRIPKPGKRVEVGDYVLVVEKMEKFAIRRIRISKKTV